MKQALKIIGVALLAVFTLIQLIPAGRSNPPLTREIRWTSGQARGLARDACYDCHSNETDWPWYAYVAPVSWWIVDHVNDGRRHLNFSEWDKPNEDADEIISQVATGEMPFPDYLRLHPEARLSSEETQDLIDGLSRTLENDPPVEKVRRKRRSGDHE